ncbi:MAG: hypothetical protein OJF62_002661 [Pseudolabrys sp.]|nr:hypothetical protein [Pseudolabrys sp.]
MAPRSCSRVRRRRRRAADRQSLTPAGLSVLSCNLCSGRALRRRGALPCQEIARMPQSIGTFGIIGLGKMGTDLGNGSAS